tara:strand:+ start:166 stop:381 length:216 start_codon:yes stop_codon:yes gene_type:complete
MPKRYNHNFYLGFSVDTDNEEFPTEQEILHALAARITGILDPTPNCHLTKGILLNELKQELDGPHDTFVND